MPVNQSYLRTQRHGATELSKHETEIAQQEATARPRILSDERTTYNCEMRYRTNEQSPSPLWSFLSSALFLDWTLIFSLIFGGCCSNVFALESILKYQADSGLIVTFIQFLFTTAMTAWPQRHVSGSYPWIIRRPKVPLSVWMINASLFWVVNTMNNWAFSFRISVPVHIILRSGGSVTTILVGFIWGKRYRKGQVFGVILLTIGVITAAISDSKTKINPNITSEDGDPKSFVFGFGILFVAQILSAVMGLYTQSIYSRYGPCWEENLLWSHVFSLFLFSTMTTELKRQFSVLWNSPSLSILEIDTFQQKLSVTMPRQIFFLCMNSLTQFFCIQGVNRLAARTSAVGVTIALNVRKLVSLLISIWVFNNQLKNGVWVGAAVVFLGGVIYAGWDAWVDGRKDQLVSKRKQQ